MVTNHHVIQGCGTVLARLEAASHEARVAAVDPGNDLALLQISPSDSLPVVSFRREKRVRPGESTIAVGYPLYGLLASNASVTVGNISAVAGINDDTRYLQFTAPVQPGNSGGPLLDERGNLIGIVEGKLNSLDIAKATGDIPQNVNFAIKAEAIRTFLDSHRVQYSVSGDESIARLDASEIGERAGGFTWLIECVQ